MKGTQGRLVHSCQCYQEICFGPQVTVIFSSPSSDSDLFFYRPRKWTNVDHLSPFGGFGVTPLKPDRCPVRLSFSETAGVGRSVPHWNAVKAQCAEHRSHRPRLSSWKRRWRSRQPGGFRKPSGSETMPKRHRWAYRHVVFLASEDE